MDKSWGCAFDSTLFHREVAELLVSTGAACFRGEKNILSYCPLLLKETMPIAFQIKSDDADDDSPENIALFGTGQFSGVKSAYILKKIKSTPFEKRDYIYNLIALYRYITKGITSMNASRGYGMLAMEYPEEHLEILKENAPDRYKEFLKQHKKDLSRERKENEKRNQTIGQQRKEWIAAGGKV